MSGAELRKWNEVPIAGVPWKFSTEYKTGDWRSERPVIDHGKCTKCLFCYIYCPEMAIKVHWTSDGSKPEKVEVDYNFCKGCGICANVCPVKAINMELERR